jgi:CPA2 family monovalent cation:H+ antiporter-2
MEDVLLLVVLTYGVSLSFGYLLQKYLRMPWMFSSLFFGIILSAFGLFTTTMNNDPFKTLETIGMYLLLFIIGFSIDFKKMASLKKYVILGTIMVIGLEGLFGSFLLFFGFPAEVSNSFLIALVTALSFATVGEAVLLPILAEFKIVKTDFGQLTLGIGTLDDIVEVLMLVVVAILPGLFPTAQAKALPNPLYVILDLVAILSITLVVFKISDIFKSALEKNHIPPIVYSLLTMFIFFSFVASGGLIAESLATVGAIFGGIVLRLLLPKERLNENEKAVEFMGYVFLSPLFFLGVGGSTSLVAVVAAPLIIGSIGFVTTGSKLLASYALFSRKLGAKYSLLMGFGLSVRFSTGLIVQYVLLNSQLITQTLFSALIATSILVTPLIIGFYSWGLSKGKPP